MQRKLLIVIIMVLTVIVIASTSFSIYSEFERKKASWHEHNEVNLHTIIDLQKQAVSVLALQLANDPHVIEAYKKDDPEIMIKAIEPFWERVKTESLIYEIHFFKPPATSFVNFSNFKSIGKDVKRVRKDIAWVTSAFKDSRHLMMCKTYAGVRATYPIVDSNGTMLGGVSLGKKVDWIPGLLKRLTEQDAMLVYTEASAKSLADKYYDRFLEGKRQVGAYIFAESTLELTDTTLASIDFDQKQQRITVDGVDHVLDIYELFDFSGDVMGYVGVFNSLQPMYETLKGAIVKNLLLLFFVVIVTFILFRRELQRVLENIRTMQLWTRMFKKRDFSLLKAYDITTFEKSMGKDEINSLMADIFHMGETLEHYYNSMDEEVSKKTMALFKANKALEEQLYTDRLTKLLNRNAFFKDVSSLTQPQLGLINIEGFRKLNDLYGVEIGNKVLIELTEYLRQHLEKENVKIYRLGADEFAVLGHHAHTDLKFELLIRDLLHAIEENDFIVGEDRMLIQLNVSAGISFESEHLLECANMARSKAKMSHQRYLVFSEEFGIEKDYAASFELTKKLRHALGNDGIVLYYQPILDREGNLLKYEALVRMEHEERVYTPLHFLNFSKETGYYKEIAHRVIEKAFEKVRQTDKTISINLSAEDIMDDETMQLILGKLEACSASSRIVFEIVESESIQNLVEVESFIDTVKNCGAKVAIDDFGAGYSNFSYLLKLSPDYLKIDGSLIKEINLDMNAQIIVRTIVGFAKELHIRTIAEFVHSEAVFTVCKELGIDEFQGYYFSEPLRDI